MIGSELSSTEESEPIVCLGLSLPTCIPAPPPNPVLPSPVCSLCSGGKSSIQKVVFHKLSPNETLFLESTSKVVKDDVNNSSFVQFQVQSVGLGHAYCITAAGHLTTDMGLPRSN